MTTFADPDETAQAADETLHDHDQAAPAIAEPVDRWPMIGPPSGA